MSKFPFQSNTSRACMIENRSSFECDQSSTS